MSEYTCILAQNFHNVCEHFENAMDWIAHIDSVVVNGSTGERGSGE